MGEKSRNNYIQINQFMKAKHMDYKKTECIILAKGVKKI